MPTYRNLSDATRGQVAAGNVKLAGKIGRKAARAALFQAVKKGRRDKREAAERRAVE